MLVCPASGCCGSHVVDVEAGSIHVTIEDKPSDEHMPLHRGRFVPRQRINGHVKSSAWLGGHGCVGGQQPMSYDHMIVTDLDGDTFFSDINRCM